MFGLGQTNWGKNSLGVLLVELSAPILVQRVPGPQSTRIIYQLPVTMCQNGILFGILNISHYFSFKLKPLPKLGTEAGPFRFMDAHCWDFTK